VNGLTTGEVAKRAGSTSRRFVITSAAVCSRNPLALLPGTDITLRMQSGESVSSSAARSLVFRSTS
jgi:hypothetical protein